MKKLVENVIKSRARQMLREGEVENAESVLAAKDLVDRLQDTIEELGKMSNDELPHLVDAIRSSLGTDKATAYQQSASSVINSLLDSVKEKKTELENATLVLSGDATADTSSDLTLPDDESGEDVPEMDSDALDNDFAEPSKTKNPLGREQRMPAKESLRRKFNKKLNEGLAESKKMLNAKIIAISEALKKTDKKKKPIVAKRLAEALRSLVTEAIKKEAKDIKKVKKLDKKKKVTETRVAATVAAKKKEQPEKYCKNKTCLYRTDADYCPKHKQTEKK